MTMSELLALEEKFEEAGFSLVWSDWSDEEVTLIDGSVSEFDLSHEYYTCMDEDEQEDVKEEMGGDQPKHLWGFVKLNTIERTVEYYQSYIDGSDQDYQNIPSELAFLFEEFDFTEV